jgi:hypothetical protein
MARAYRCGACHSLGCGSDRQVSIDFPARDTKAKDCAPMSRPRQTVSTWRGRRPSPGQIKEGPQTLHSALPRSRARRTIGFAYYGYIFMKGRLAGQGFERRHLLRALGQAVGKRPRFIGYAEPRVRPKPSDTAPPAAPAIRVRLESTSYLSTKQRNWSRHYASRAAEGRFRRIETMPDDFIWYKLRPQP